MIPAAAGEPGGSIHLLKRGWTLADGSYWRLFGVLMLLLVVAIVVVLFVGQIMVGLVVRTAFGTVQPLSLGALIAALLTSAVSGLFGAGASVLLARMYAQLAGRSEPVEEVFR